MMASQAGSSSSSPSNMHEEFTVRIPRDSKKVFTMMKFGTSSTLDFAKMGEQPVKMERENNLREYKTANDIDLLPKFGAGSEYGRELKEESRRKKYGIMLKKYNPDDQPWILKLGGGKQGKRYKGIREGTISENTSYYIFTKSADGAFEAFPVGEWYNFTPIVKYKYLNSEEAEEEFERRDKTLNYFNIMLKKRLRKEENNDFDDDDDEEEGGKKKKGKKKATKSKNMILTDMDEWNDLEMSDDDEDDEDDAEENGAAKKKKKNLKGRKIKKGPKNSKKNSDDEAIEESDEGDYDDREVDYISDSGSSDSLSGPENDDKDKNQEKGVDEEKGLRNILDSGDEDEEEEEEKEKVTEEIDEKQDKKEEKVKKGDDSSSSSSDEDSDLEKNMSSAIFMQKDKKVSKKDGVESDKSKAGEASSSGADKKDGTKGLKRKTEKNPDGKAVPSKKHKIDDSEGITEDVIRRYLARKPMTTTNLVQKFRSKKLNMSNEKITHTIAQLLKKINPEKTMINKALYLSLKKE